MKDLETLKKEIAAYKAMEDDLLQHHTGKFVIIQNGKLAGAFDTFDNAADAAINEFGLGPYLIRQVGAKEEMPMPASVAYRPLHASH